ncbi:hypothetical protein LIER_38705 [Lithospermum erythrorhizon]|uniref:Uncharacterized protein n=1 Tax=Lithospermum erythrorhizon TaxID=34254 RepID=A0AAV3Q3K6_LITER
MVDLRYSSTSQDEYQEHGDATEYLFSDNEESDHSRKKPYMIRWKSGKRVDPRLLTTLESFKEIYDEKRDLFNKIFPGMYNEFVDVFNKLGEMTRRNKEARTMERSRTLERSSSFGSPRPSLGMEMNDEFFDEKFKVRPPTIIIGGLDGGKGG